ncbi:phytanoyl-CoA dioxygenase, peroxisomal-like [Ostrinia nubilalis]|uniref:phytanoyl-CoA dioxygenase, peroxisomal-like n=1 Tax=Ostrinia nubilalis TaxID=29057 RepID=UPI0030824944
MEKSAREYKLSAEEKQFFADNGYLVIRQFYDTAACENLRKRFLQVVNKEVKRGRMAVIEDLELKKKTNIPEEYVNKLNSLSYDSEFQKHTEDARMVDVLSQLLTKDTVIMNSMLINKPPGTPWHPPHQDVYHIPLRPVDKILTTWTAVDEATQDNGCLFVIPGSHKANIIYEEHILPGFVNSLFFSIKDLDLLAPMNKWVALPMRPGDTVFINSLLIHGSFPNTTKKYRKAITNVYASAECAYVDVTGTVQEPFAIEAMKELRSRGYEFANYKDAWRFRSKKIGKSKSKL